MGMYNTCLKVSVLCAVFVGACDLQPKISSIPDSIGMFIEDRYPALLADPESQPDIYNSAVTDYGVYASPELYGSENIDDYVLYASVDDYVLVPESIEEQNQQSMAQEKEIEQEIAQDYIIVPVYGGNTVLDEDASQQKQEEQTKAKDTKIENKQYDKKQDKDVIVVVRGDTVYSLARKNNMTVSEFAKINNLQEPYTLSVGQKLTTRASAVKKQEIPNVISQEKVQEIKAEKVAAVEPVKPTATKRVDLQEITVARGDTLYSLSRKYEIPVNDLAVMNKLSAPFNLSVGQKLKVPKMDTVQTRSATEIKVAKATKTEKKITPAKTVNKKTETPKTTQKPEKPAYTTVQEKPKTKISSDPKKQLPKITSRSSSKFSWPVRGTILSGYGPKKGGLVNDGINISAPLGTAIKAAENGVVAYAGNEVKGMGNLIIVQHSDGWMTVYAHLSSMDVRRGAKVSVGQQIGKIGKTGKVDKPQLHFEIRKGTKAYNPTQYLKK